MFGHYLNHDMADGEHVIRSCFLDAAHIFHQIRTRKDGNLRGKISHNRCNEDGRTITFQREYYSTRIFDARSIQN